MDFNTFLPTCINMVHDYTIKHMDSFELVHVKDGFTTDDVYVVWYNKTLNNAKALLSTNLPDDMYYEITYNGDKDEYYFDAYKKTENIRIASNSNEGR